MYWLSMQLSISKIKFFLGDCTHEIAKSLRLIPAVTFRHCVIKTPVSSRRFMYKLLRNFLFLFPAESVHHFSMKSLKLICNFPGGKKIIASLFSAQHSQFGKQIFNLRFTNPIGLHGTSSRHLRLKALNRKVR